MELKIVDFFMSLKTSFLDALFTFTNFLGEAGFAFFVFLLLYWLFSKEKAFKFGLIYLISVGINNLLKIAFKRERPHNLLNNGYSFPSGHAQGYSVVVSQIYLECKANDFPKSKRWKLEILIEMVIAGLLVGIGRMYFGMHYLSDVVAGLVLGVAIALSCTAICNFIAQKYNIKLWKILICLMPLLLVVYFTVTFTSIIQYRAIYDIYAVLGFIFGASAGYLLDCFKLKSAIEGDYKNRLKKASLGTLLMGLIYFIIKTKVDNIYFVPLVYLIFGFVGVAIMPVVLNKTFVYKKES